MTKCRLIENFDEENEKRIAAGKSDAEYFGPGAMWFCPWYYDPKDPSDAIKGFCSIHYMQDWSTKRPPIMVICPDGSHWCPDQKSSNGTGWTVTGEAPNITCNPSIVVKNYHGYLRDGVFTPDLEGRTYDQP